MNPVLWREWWRARSSLGARIFWLLYFVAAATATIMSVHSFWTGQNPPDLVAVVGYEVGIGLLAVAVRSSLAWSDEKTAGREGLDLLLATPLSASTIAMGKWWGAYREVLPIVFLPVVSAMVLAQGAGAPPAPQGMVTGFVRVAVVVVILGQVLIYGAAFVSLGLLLATRLARPARSALATVGLFRCAHDRSADRERDSVSAFKPRPRRGARRRQPAWRTDRDPDVVLLQSLFRGGNVSPAVRFRLARRGWMLCLGPQMVDNSSFRPLDGPDPRRLLIDPRLRERPNVGGRGRAY